MEYYASHFLKKCQNELEFKFNACALETFISSLTTELDNIVLPAIATEIHTANLNGFLNGSTGHERYISFFVQNDSYTDNAKAIHKKYPLISEFLDHIINSSFHNLYKCTKRLIKDRKKISKHLNIEISNKLDSIKIISESDRHRGEQSLLLVFQDLKKLIYKPTDLTPDFLFSVFRNFLCLDSPFDQKCMKVLCDNKKYGWIEFIESLSCTSLKQVKEFYTKAGVLLAITEALNYTDGHDENLIAHQNYPVLLDGETFFQNYSNLNLNEKDVFSTLLIQKRKDQSREKILGFNSAFQSSQTWKIYFLDPHPINERSDEIRVGFQTMKDHKPSNCPMLENLYIRADSYISEIIDGYKYAYDRISDFSSKLFLRDHWWRILANARCRVLIRNTVNYLYLLRKLQQPEFLKSKEIAKNLLKENLGLNIFSKYEINDLLSQNIPYYYHIPNRRHLYDGNNNCYVNIFKKCYIDSLTE